MFFLRGGKAASTCSSIAHQVHSALPRQLTTRLSCIAQTSPHIATHLLSCSCASALHLTQHPQPFPPQKTTQPTTKTARAPAVRVPAPPTSPNTLNPDKVPRRQNDYRKSLHETHTCSSCS